MYTLPGREWMWRVDLSKPTVLASPGVRPGQAVYSQNRDGYEVQGVGGEEVGVKCGRM